MYGVFLARELLPDGTVYYSEDTHYSASKILRMLHLPNLMIKSQPDGCMDLDDFRETVRINRDSPPIVFANIGTTMKGAVDDVPGMQGHHPSGQLCQRRAQPGLVKGAARPDV